MPSFVLDSENLDNYRPWLRRAREWARKQGGDIVEQPCLCYHAAFFALVALQKVFKSHDGCVDRAKAREMRVAVSRANREA